jgi:hypothetical protein
MVDTISSTGCVNYALYIKIRVLIYMLLLMLCMSNVGNGQFSLTVAYPANSQNTRKYNNKNLSATYKNNAVIITRKDIQTSVRDLFFGSNDKRHNITRHVYYSIPSNRHFLVKDVTNAIIKSYLIARHTQQHEHKRDNKKQISSESLLETIEDYKDSNKIKKLTTFPRGGEQQRMLRTSMRNFRLKRIASTASKMEGASRLRTRLYTGDPLGLDQGSKWVKTAIDGLGASLSPKAIPKAAAAHLASMNLNGCWDTIKAKIKNNCQDLAKGGIKTILKRTVSAGRGVIYSSDETGATDSNVHGMVSGIAECVFGNFCTGKSFEG